jgi:hypothetical protein
MKYDDLKWKGKSYELDYKIELVAEYPKLKEQGMPDDRIACFRPEMNSNGEQSSSPQR